VKKYILNADNETFCIDFDFVEYKNKGLVYIHRPINKKYLYTMSNPEAGKTGHYMYRFLNEDYYDSCCDFMSNEEFEKIKKQILKLTNFL